jgi:hypothetical protein
MIDGLSRFLAGTDGGLATVVKAGDRVRHFNTGQWGKVLQVVPQHDGTAELEVEREQTPGAFCFEGKGWWATYHIDKYEPAAGQVAGAGGSTCDHAHDEASETQTDCITRQNTPTGPAPRDAIPADLRGSTGDTQPREAGADNSGTEGRQ